MSSLVCAVVLLAGFAASGFRWARVCQREHYIPGSCGIAVLRWIRHRPPNAVIVGVTVVAAVLATAIVRSSMLAAGVLLIFCAVFPWGMPLVGTPPVKWTQRMVRVAIVSLVLVTTQSALLFVVLGWYCLLVVLPLVPLTVDAAAWLLLPIERRSLEKFRLAAAARLQRVNPIVVAVTGSWGKTSTKSHIRDLLSQRYEVVASPASYNNQSGLSKAINDGLGDLSQVFVAEMGMYKPGEIRSLCSWIKPDVAVICSVGPMHMERAGSIEAIVVGKAEILERAKSAVLWIDNPYLRELSTTARGPELWTVGYFGDAAAKVTVEVTQDLMRLRHGVVVVGECAVGGGLHAGNVACAVAVALALDVPTTSIATLLRTLSVPSHRSEARMSDTGLLVIDDTFNSNPAGAAAAIDLLGTSVTGQRVVVTPGMVELGSAQFTANRDLAAHVRESGARLLAVGWTNRAALLQGCPDAVAVPNRSAARDWVRSHLGPNDGVLWENDLPDHYP